MIKRWVYGGIASVISGIVAGAGSRYLIRMLSRVVGDSSMQIGIAIGVGLLVLATGLIFTWYRIHLQRRREWMEAITALGEAIIGREVEEIAQITVQAVAHVLDVEVVGIALKQNPTAPPELIACWALNPTWEQATRETYVHRAEAARVIESGEPLIVDRRIDAIPYELHHIGARTLVAVPLATHQRTVGALFVISRHVTMGREDRTWLERVGHQVATAIEAAERQAETRRRWLDHKEIRDQALQEARLSAIGQLVASVAHELSNPLSSILSYTSMLIRDPHLPPELREDVRTIHRNAERATQISRSLLTFVRAEKEEHRLISVNDLVQETLLLQGYSLREHGIEFLVDADPREPIISADYGRIQQVLINLITNAEQAMERSRVKQLLISTEADTEHEVIRIAVSDTGPGVPPSLRERIFEPFFTARPLGKGTGLGLTIARHIVNEHNGRMWVEESASGGARFVVELPLTSLKRPAAIATIPTAPPALSPEPVEERAEEPQPQPQDGEALPDQALL